MFKKSVLSFLVFCNFLILTNMSSAGEQSVYDFAWLDADKEVFVLQNRKYQKASKFHINLGGGITTSGSFVDSTNYQGRAGYFFTEDWGLEFVYSKNSGKENEAAKSVRNVGGAGSIPFRRIVDNYMGGFLVWSPFYAKINTFNKIIYFDWLLGLGYGKIEETNNKQSVIDGVDRPGKSETHNALMWETGLKFYINEYFDVRLDFTFLHYKAEQARSIDANPKQAWYTNSDLTLSLGFSF